MENSEVKIDREKMAKVRRAIRAAIDASDASPLDVMYACCEIIGEQSRKAHGTLTDDGVALAEQTRSKIKSAAIFNTPSEVWKIRW